MQTFILSKDATLEASIAHFQQKLSELGFNIEETSWLNPVPNVWSVHIRDRDCHLCFANGKGTSKKAALASAFGEYFERLSTNYFFADFYLGLKIAKGDFVHYPNEKWFPAPTNNSLPAGILDNLLRTFYNPEHELRSSDLIDLQSNNRSRGICSLPFTRQSDQQTVYIPMNIIGNLYASNGMAAGNTINEARVQALSEILERYVKKRIITEAISLPLIPGEKLQNYPIIEEAIKKLEKEGFPILSYDASLGGKYPVVCVVLFNPIYGTCYASFGSHPIFGVALERTVTELLQGRSLKNLDVFAAPTFDNNAVAEHANMETHFIDSSGLISWDMFKEEADYPFVDWKFNGSNREAFAALMHIFNAQASEVYIADYQHLGVYTCRIIVPGTSEIYPVEDLLLANNNMGAHLRNTLLSLPGIKLDPKEYLALIQQLDKEGICDFIRLREFLGIASGTDNAWYTLRIGELKAMLALAGRDQDQALIWTEWTEDFNASILSKTRLNYYRCLKTLLLLETSEPERDLAQYYCALVIMYNQETVDAAAAALNGMNCFNGLFAVDSDLQTLQAHRALLSAYEKLQKAKRSFWRGCKNF